MAAKQLIEGCLTGLLLEHTNAEHLKECKDLETGVKLREGCYVPKQKEEST